MPTITLSLTGTFILATLESYPSTPSNNSIQRLDAPGTVNLPVDSGSNAIYAVVNALPGSAWTITATQGGAACQIVCNGQQGASYAGGSGAAVTLVVFPPAVSQL